MHPSPRQPARRSRSGFSFVELMMALTVAAAIMAVAYPRFAPMRESAGVRTSKQALTAYLSTARQTAIRRGGVATFNVSGNTISVTVDGATTPIEPAVNLAERHGVTLTTSPTLTSVTFNARGAASPRLGSSTVLRLSRGASTDSLCLTVLGMLGKCGL